MEVMNFKHFIFLNIIDIILTYYAITYVGLSEGNPILSPIFQQIGLITGLVLIKLLGLMVIYGLICNTPPELKFRGTNINAQKISTSTICLLMVLVVANNISQTLLSSFL